MQILYQQQNDYNPFKLLAFNGSLAFVIVIFVKNMCHFGKNMVYLNICFDITSVRDTDGNRRF